MGAPRDSLLGSIGAAVRRLREDRGLSRRALSESSGVSERFLAELEAGSGNISVGRLADVARSLGTTAASLLAEAEGGPSALAGTALLAGLSREERNEAERWLRARFGGSGGPLIALVGLRALLKAREPLYAQAELAVDTSALGAEGAVREILRGLGFRRAK